MSDVYDDELDDNLDDEADENEIEDQEDELEPDDDQEVDETPDEDEPPARAAKPSRGENRVAAATRTAAEAKRKADDLQRELDQLKAERNQPPRETPDQVRERLAQMDPVERLEYLREQDRREFTSTLQRIEFNAQDSSDKTAFEALCARNPVASKLRDDVEARLADMRRSGTTAPRETVLRWVIGDRALANAGRATGKARKTADANRARQTARPGNSRGDAPATDRRSIGSQARDKRLNDINI